MIDDENVPSTGLDKSNNVIEPATDEDNLKPTCQLQQDARTRHQPPQCSSSCSSLTSGLGHSDQSICNEKSGTSSSAENPDIESYDLGRRDSTLSSGSVISQSMPPMLPGVELREVDKKLRMEIKKFVEVIFTDSQSISLERKAQFGKFVQTPEARLLFAMYVDDHRVHGKKVSELTFYSLAQYFSIVLFECLLAEDFRPAKIIMNMMFTYYYEQATRKPTAATLNGNSVSQASPSTIASSTATNNANDDMDSIRESQATKTYLYTMLKDQQIFKSIRFWTSAFYESVIIERNNHSIFVNREPGKLSNEKREEELDCSKNITFGLLGSFIHNMSLLDLSHEFCKEFLDKHSTIADLSEEQLEMLRANMKTMFQERASQERGSRNSVSPTSLSSTSDKLTTFINKWSNRLNNSHNTGASSGSSS